MLKTYMYSLSRDMMPWQKLLKKEQTNKTINGHKILRAIQPDNRKVLPSGTNEYQVLFFPLHCFTPAVRCFCNLSLFVTSLFFVSLSVYL